MWKIEKPSNPPENPLASRPHLHAHPALEADELLCLCVTLHGELAGRAEHHHADLPVAGGLAKQLREKGVSGVWGREEVS